jgi:ubiquinone/menaquinone biosynthesis C-methylase UbiE
MKGFAWGRTLFHFIILSVIYLLLFFTMQDAYLALLVDFHLEGERQGPGSKTDTLRAFDLLGLDQNNEIKVADIGCGTGASTLVLAEMIRGKIVAVDIFPQFLEILEQKARVRGLQNKIDLSAQSMENLSFQPEELDLIWSEGAVYSMGFDKALKNWSTFLKPGGHLAVSEVTWKTLHRPKEIEDFWQQEYPEIDTVSGKMQRLEVNGFLPVGYFPLPISSWLDQYYKPMESRFQPFLEKHHHCAEARQVVAEHRREIALFQRFKDYYSYGFYIAKKLE